MYFVVEERKIEKRETERDNTITYLAPSNGDGRPNFWLHRNKVQLALFLVLQKRISQYEISHMFPDDQRPFATTLHNQCTNSHCECKCILYLLFRVIYNHYGWRKVCRMRANLLVACSPSLSSKWKLCYNRLLLFFEWCKNVASDAR